MAIIGTIPNKSPTSLDIEFDPSGTKRAKVSHNGGIILGNDSSDLNNVKLHRGPSGSLQIVQGSDITAEGSDSPNKENINVNAITTVVPILPIGTILTFAGSLAPTGYLFCNGDPVSRTTYSALFSVINTLYGVGDGLNTFNLPDTRAAFLRGAGGTSIRFTQNKNVPNPGVYESDALQGHRHEIYRDGAYQAGAESFVSGQYIGYINSHASVFADAERNIVTDGINGTPRTDNETRPNNVSVNYIIKY